MFFIRPIVHLHFTLNPIVLIVNTDTIVSTAGVCCVVQKLGPDKLRDYVRQCDNEGSSALHMAVSNGVKEVTYLATLDVQSFVENCS